MSTGGTYAYVSRQFMYGSSGQIADKKEMAEAAERARYKREREAALKEDYDYLVDYEDRYEDRHQQAETAYYAMEAYIESIYAPLPFLKSNNSYVTWMAMHGVDEDPKRLWDLHFKNFADIYEMYAAEDILQNKLIEAKKHEKPKVWVHPGRDHFEDLADLKD